MALWFIVDSVEHIKTAQDSTLFWLSLLQNQEIFWVEHVDTKGFHAKTVKVRYEEYDFLSKPKIEFQKSFLCPWKDIEGPVFFRLDPPVDGKFRKVLSLLATAGSHLKIVNNPLAMSTLSEKLIPLVGGDEIPFRTTGEATTEHVIKDLWGFGGGSVRKPTQITKLSETELAQDFDEKIFDGERRMYIIGEQLVGCLVKLPQGKEFRSNLQWGSNLSWAEPTEYELKRSQFYQNWLRQRGVELATVDFIGQRIIEVNITCPGLLYPSALLTGFKEKNWSTLSDALKALTQQSLATTRVTGIS